MENDGKTTQHLANAYENFDQWFNDILFSDLKVFISTDSGSAFFNCHKFIIQRRSPAFLEDLLQRKFEENNSSDNIDRAIIIPDLENDLDLTRLFLSMFYMGHEAYVAIQYTIGSNHKDKLIELCEKYGLYCVFKPPKPAFETIKVTVPVPRRRTVGGDIIISIKGTNNNFMCHKIVLVHYSDYFKAMFASEMKEKSAQQIELDITGFMNDDQKTPLFQLFLESIYTGNEPKLPSVELAMHGDQLAEQYFCPMFAKHCMNFLTRQLTPKTIVEVISTALRLERYDFVELATDYFIPNIVTVALQDNFSSLPLDYILNLDFDYKNTIYHHCILESTNDNACLNAIKKLEEMIGKDSRVNILANNASYDSTVHLAAYSARPKTLQYLINRGVDVNEMNAKDMTALDSKPEYPEIVYQYAAHCNPFFEQFRDLWPKYVRLLEQNPVPPLIDLDREEYEQVSLKWFHEALAVRNFTMIKTMIQQLKIPMQMKVLIQYQNSDDEKAKIEISEDNECSIYFYSTFGDSFQTDGLSRFSSNKGWRFDPVHKIRVDWNNYHIGKLNPVSEEFVSSRHGSNFLATVEANDFLLTLYNEEKHDHFVIKIDKNEISCLNFLWYMWIDHNVKEENKARMFLQDIPPDETLPSGFGSDTASYHAGLRWNSFPRIFLTEFSQETKENCGCKIC